MAKYVDGFVIPVPKKNLEAYKKIAKKAQKIWMEHGAIAYYETVMEDSKTAFGISFPKLAQSKPSETIIFSWIVYKSRKHRDSVNKNVMADPRIKEIDPGMKTFDCSKMAYGGFDVFVEA